MPSNFVHRAQGVVPLCPGLGAGRVRLRPDRPGRDGPSCTSRGRRRSSRPCLPTRPGRPGRRGRRRAPAWPTAADAPRRAGRAGSCLPSIASGDLAQVPVMIRVAVSARTAASPRLAVLRGQVLGHLPYPVRQHGGDDWPRRPGPAARRPRAAPPARPCRPARQRAAHATGRRCPSARRLRGPGRAPRAMRGEPAGGFRAHLLAEDVTEQAEVIGVAQRLFPVLGR